MFSGCSVPEWNVPSIGRELPIRFLGCCVPEWNVPSIGRDLPIRM